MLASVSFTKDAAKKTGRSARTIQRKVEIGEKLDRRARGNAEQNGVQDDQSRMKRLADLPVQKQRERARNSRPEHPEGFAKENKPRNTGKDPMSALATVFTG